MLSLLRNLTQLLGYAVRQKLVVARRWRQWQDRREPFVHETLEGLRFELYPHELIDGYIYADGIYERRILRLLQKRLSGRTMLDIGANIGNHAIYLHRRFSEVHCFEPNPETVRRLSRNLALNDIGNVSVHPVGLGDASGRIPFRSNTTGNLGGGSFAKEDFPVSDHLPVVRGDDYLGDAGIRNIDFMKIDVEGFEPLVLKGLQETIARERPIIMLEYDPRGTGMGLFRNFADLLPDYLFCEAIRTPSKRHPVSKVVFAVTNGLEPDLLPLEEPEDRFYEALLCFPSSERLNSFQKSSAGKA